jgi:cobalt-zinc-cadmium resistance protein CzcA
MSPAEFAALRITTGRRSVPLAASGRLEREEGPVKIDREMGSRYSVVIANVSGRDLVGFVEEAKAKIMARRCRCRRATAWPGAASSRTSSGRPPGWLVMPVALG